MNKKAIFALSAIVVTVALLGACSQSSKSQQGNNPDDKFIQAMNDVKMISDNTVDGIRTIRAETCSEVCSSEIIVQVKEGIIQNAEIVGGCPGNTLGVCALVKGMPTEEAISRLEGILCGSKSTSCPDQLTKVLRML